MIETVAYMRCSGVSQIDGDSFPRQIAAISSCCHSKGLQLIHEYREEGIPGKFDEERRPAFQQMVSDLLGNGCRTIVIEGMSRLAREYRTQEHLIIYLASKGLTLISADTGEDITAAMMGDPMRRALVQIQGIFSELDKNMLVAKLKKARERIRATGQKCDGRRAFGENPHEVPILERMKQLRADGTGYESIAAALNFDNIPTRMGKKWNASTVHKILSRKNKGPVLPDPLITA